MSITKNLFFAGVLVFLMMIPATALAKSDNAIKGTIKVDGLSCPFCAYGLEKKLKDVSWIENTKVFVDAGKAEFSVKSLDGAKLEDLNKAIKKGGFTPNGIKFKAIGKIEQSEAGVTLLLKDGKSRFLLVDDKKVEMLLKELKGKQIEVEVEGTPKELNGKLILAIETYRFLEARKES